MSATNTIDPAVSDNNTLRSSSIQDDELEGTESDYGNEETQVYEDIYGTETQEMVSLVATGIICVSTHHFVAYLGYGSRGR
jgi:hypothetical protein